MDKSLIKNLYTVGKLASPSELKESQDLAKNYRENTHVSKRSKTDEWKSYTKKIVYVGSSLLGGGLGYVTGATSTLVMELYKGIYNFPQLNPLEIAQHINYNGGIAAAVGLVAGPLILKCLKSTTFSFFSWVYNGFASIFKK